MAEHFRQERYGTINKMKLTKIVQISLILILSGCQQVFPTSQETNIINIIDNSKRTTINTSASTVQDVLLEQNINLEPLDIVSPNQSSNTYNEMEINVTRIEEGFQNEELIIPFEKQIVQNESLPVGDSRLLQIGKNVFLNDSGFVCTPRGAKMPNHW